MLSNEMSESTGVNVLDLFSGTGMFSLGLERAGFHTVAFCENNADCQRVLRYHWPAVPIHGDIRELTADRLGGSVDLIAGGFPCQPYSSASRGRKVAVDLWPEFHRVVTELRPDWVIAENVPGIGYGGVDRVCSDLEGSGYTVWPFDLDTALPQRQRGRIRFIWVAHANRDRKPLLRQHAPLALVRPVPRRRTEDHSPPVGVDDGLPGRMARLHALGNAITPTIAELVGRAVMRAYTSTASKT
jgi:DNA (cytosine-5)-methyltransferase 1